MLEDASKKTKWSWNSGNSKHGDEIGVGGQKLKLSNIGIELHVESPGLFSSMFMFFLITYYFDFLSLFQLFYLLMICPL